MPSLDAELAPLLSPTTAGAVRRGRPLGAAEDAPEGDAALGHVERTVELLIAGLGRLVRELRDSVGLLLIALALAAAAVVAPARVVRAATARRIVDATAGAAEPQSQHAPPPRIVPMPPGHARGVLLWAQNGAVRLHVRVFSPEAMTPQLREGDVSSSFLEALRLAARSGNAVLLIPPTGGALETFAWSDTIAALTAAGMFVACLDLRGQGRSAAPRGRYSMPMLAADAAAAVQRCCGGTAMHVFGWSLGAGVGLQLALDRPELVRSLCMFGVTAGFHGGEPSAAAKACKAVVASPRLVAALGVGGHGMLLAAMMAFRTGGPRERAEARRAIHAANTLHGCVHPAGVPKSPQRASPTHLHRRYMSTVCAWQPFDVTARLGSLRCPLLHLHTAQDGRCGGHTAEKKARDVALVNAGGGRAMLRTQAGPWSHAWPLEDPPSFNAQLQAWLRDAGRAPVL